MAGLSALLPASGFSGEVDVERADLAFTRIKNCHIAHGEALPALKRCIKGAGMGMTDDLAQNLARMQQLRLRLGRLRGCSKEFLEPAKAFEPAGSAFLCFDIVDGERKAEGLFVFRPDPAEGPGGMTLLKVKF
jgi:hypothetical protein